MKLDVDSAVTASLISFTLMLDRDEVVGQYLQMILI